MFNVVIIGGESTENFDFFKFKCAQCLKNKVSEGISLYTTGDDFVDQFGKRYGIDVNTIYTRWKDYGKNALKMRNQELLKKANAIIFFEDGTKDSKIILDMAKERNIPYRIIKK